MTYDYSNKKCDNFIMTCRQGTRSTFATLLLCFLSIGCIRSSSGPEVVVYSALDSQFSQPIFDDFEKKTGIHVRASFDAESTKTLQLYTALQAESKSRTRCDLFWNNEILNTLRLDQANLLATYRPVGADAFPKAVQSPNNRWFGFAARARVLIVNTDIVTPDEMPTSIYDLLAPQWKGKIGMAKPLFGTTATHAVCLFERLGDEKAMAFFDGLKLNHCQILSGNKQVAEDVASGKIAFGLTDTDDAIMELEQGFPVKLVYPDSAPGELGTLFIPNTLAVLRNCPRSENAKKLADYLLSAEVETKLANGPSAQIPLHGDVQLRLRVETPATVQAMEVDFESAAIRWNDVSKYLKKNFSGAE